MKVLEEYHAKVLESKAESQKRAKRAQAKAQANETAAVIPVEQGHPTLAEEGHQLEQGQQARAVAEAAEADRVTAAAFRGFRYDFHQGRGGDV